MGNVTITIKSYNYNRPRLLTIEEFNSYKQIYSIDPNYSLIPKSEFWDEFSTIKWSAIILICSLPLIAILEIFSLITGFAFMVLIFNLLGNANSMINYSSMNSKRKEVFRKLENVIKQSNNYEEFRINFKNVK